MARVARRLHHHARRVDAGGHRPFGGQLGDGVADVIGEDREQIHGQKTPAGRPEKGCCRYRSSGALSKSRAYSASA